MRRAMSDRDAAARRARRELERLDTEGGFLGAPSLKSRARSVSDHFAGRDGNPGDPIEVWGKRIGRGLGAIAFIVLALFLLRSLTL